MLSHQRLGYSDALTHTPAVGANAVLRSAGETDYLQCLLGLLAGLGGSEVEEATYKLQQFHAGHPWEEHGIFRQIAQLLVGLKVRLPGAHGRPRNADMPLICAQKPGHYLQCCGLARTVGAAEIEVVHGHLVAEGPCESTDRYRCGVGIETHALAPSWTVVSMVRGGAAASILEEDGD